MWPLLARSPHAGNSAVTSSRATLCFVQADTPAYTIDLRFGIDYPDPQPVVDYLTLKRDHVINAAQAPGARNLPYQMVVNSQTFRSGQPTRTIPEYTQPWHGTQSLVLKEFW